MTQSVLLIDDDALQLRILARQFNNLGVAAITACADPAEALLLLRAEPTRFALVVCDLQMPVVDGLSVLRVLAELRFGGAVLIASGEEGALLECACLLAQELGLQVLGGVGKPVMPARLREVLEPWLS